MSNKKTKVILNSLWILLDIPGVMFGVLTGLGMFLAGKKVGEKRWKITGIVYMVVLLILEIGFATTKGKTSDTLATWYVAAYLVAVVHSIVILIRFIPRFSRQLEGSKTVQTVTESKPITNGAAAASFTVSKDLYSVANSAEPEKKANITFNNSYYDSLNLTASAISTKTPTKEDRAKQNAEKIDINTCTEQELASLPGVSVVAAKKAIAYRDSNNGFASEDEFYKAAGVQLHFLKQIKDKIRCGEEHIATSQEVTNQDVDEVVSEIIPSSETVSNREKKGRVLDI